jgi:hypothetical protein
MVAQVTLLQPALRRLPPESARQLQRIVSGAERRVMPPIGAITMVTAAGVLGTLIGAGTLTYPVGALMVDGLVLTIAEAIVSIRLYRPQEEQLLEAGDTKYAEVVPRFTGVQTLRLPLSAIALGCFLAAALVGPAS